MKILPKPPSEFYLNLAGFKKSVYQFKWSLSLKDNFRADNLASILLILGFSLWLFFNHTLSLRVTTCLSLESHLYFQSPLHLCTLNEQLFVLAPSRVRGTDESSVLKKSWVSLCSFKIFWKVGSWRKQSGF